MNKLDAELMQGQKETLSAIWKAYFSIQLDAEVWAIALEEYPSEVIAAAIKKCARVKLGTPEMTVKQMLSYIDSVCHVTMLRQAKKSNLEQEEHVL